MKQPKPNTKPSRNYIRCQTRRLYAPKTSQNVGKFIPKVSLFVCHRAATGVFGTQ